MAPCAAHLYRRGDPDIVIRTDLSGSLGLYGDLMGIIKGNSSHKVREHGSALEVGPHRQEPARSSTSARRRWRRRQTGPGAGIASQDRWCVASIRHTKGISLEAISRETKLKISILEAIENGDFDALPGGIYSTSYIRQYARAIGADEASLVQALSDQAPDSRSERPPLVLEIQHPTPKDKEQIMQAAAPSAGHQSRDGQAVFGKTVVVKGEIQSSEPLTIEGHVEGTIEIGEHLLTVASTGSVRAQIKAREIDVFGSVEGQVEAASKVYVRKGAQFIGDIHSVSVVIEEGAFMKGSIDLTRVESRTDS